MPRYKLTVEYDGTGYAGWQRQDVLPSIQQTLEKAIAQYCQTHCPIVAAGRTDAGVHASAQVVHVDLPVARECFSIRQGINFYLHDTRIVVLHAEQVADNFHARFDAKRRHYIYRIVNRSSPLAIDAFRAWHVPKPLNVSAIKEATHHLIGQHDFSSFRASECQSKSPIRTLEVIDIMHEHEDITFHLAARSFLHHQVRAIIGTLSLVGLGKWTPDRVKAARDMLDRRAGGPTAPAHGLYFTKVEY
jgi:tRNA pseudouridine38-40 synthase